MTAALLAAVAVPASLPAQPASKPASAKKAAPAPKPDRPKPGELLQTKLPGGWMLQVAGHPDRTEVRAPAFAPRPNRALMLVTVISKDFKTLEASEAVLVDPNGTVVRNQSLAQYRPLSAGISPDGTMAAIGTQPYQDTAGAGALLFFDATGRRNWKKPFVPGQEVLFGPGWIALWTPPTVQTALDGDPEAMPPARISHPVTFYRPDGSRAKPGTSIAGSVSLAGDALAAVANGKLELFKTSLVRKSSTPLGFQSGIPYASADGSVIAVGDYSEGENLPDRPLAFFDAAGKKTGEVRLPAAYGVTASIAPDGALALAAAATTGPEGPLIGLDAATKLSLVAADRTGKVRWRFETKPSSATAHFTDLSVSAGGRRASAALRTGPEGGDGLDRVLVFDEAGKVIYSAEGEFDAAWLDPAGAWLWTVEAGGLSRLKVDALIAGTAFPKDFGIDDALDEETLRSLDEPDEDAGEPEVWKDAPGE